MTNKTDKLTPEQESRIPEFLDKYFKIGFRTETTNQAIATRCVESVYKEILDRSAPRVIFCTSPIELVFFSLICEVLGDEETLSSEELRLIWQALDVPQKEFIRSTPKPELTPKLQEILDRFEAEHKAGNTDVAKALKRIYYFSWRVYNCAVYDFVTNVCGLVTEKDLKQKTEILIEATKELHALITYDTVCFVSDFPEEMHIDEQNRLHNPTGGAIVYRDGYSLYALNGEKVSRSEVKDKIYEHI